MPPRTLRPGVHVIRVYSQKQGRALVGSRIEAPGLVLFPDPGANTASTFRVAFDAGHTTVVATASAVAAPPTTSVPA